MANTKSVAYPKRPHNQDLILAQKLLAMSKLIPTALLRGWCDF